jgi:arylsulfatase A-like enzyme
VAAPASASPGRARTAQVALLAAALTVPLALACSLRGPQPPERLVLIVIDTLRRDHLGVYGSPVPTPHIDALAARGQRFDNVVASFHQTTMSMGSLFTGRTPSMEAGDTRVLSWNGDNWCGLARLALRPGAESCLPPGIPTLAEGMREAGYWTIGVASNQFLYEPSGFSRGFDDWVQVDDRPPVAGKASRQRLKNAHESRTWHSVNRAAVSALNRRPRDRFFLYVHYVDVHDYVFQKRTYAEAVKDMDEGVGRLLAQLESAELLEGTVVVLTSDHGEQLGEMHNFPGEYPKSFGHYGNPSFQEQLRIPLIIAPARGGDPSRFLRTQDLYGVLLGIAGVQREPSHDLEEGEHYIGEARYRTYRKGKWKTLLRRSDGRQFLYDLEADPLEKSDVAARFPDVTAAHVARIEQLTKSLAASGVPQRELSEAERDRLRSLGYLPD